MSLLHYHDYIITFTVRPISVTSTSRQTSRGKVTSGSLASKTAWYSHTGHVTNGVGDHVTEPTANGMKAEDRVNKSAKSKVEFVLEHDTGTYIR